MAMSLIGPRWAVCCLTLGASLFVLAAGDAATLNPDVEPDETIYAWELKHSGKYRLVWYYPTRNGVRANQPDRVLVHDKSFFIQPGVRPPTINGVYLLEHSTVHPGEAVLDIGTGTGVHAIFAADKAARTVATDIYAPAVENARINARLHGVDSQIDFRVGDLFEPIADGEQFDVFFVNINFPFSTNDDKRNALHERLFSEIHQYMKPGARIYYQTSFVRNIPTIHDMLTRNNFQIMEMHMEYFDEFKHEALFLTVQQR